MMRKTGKIQLLAALAASLLSTPALAPAEVALLVGEPFGKFGFFNPTGHAAVYLSGVCAETPVQLRLCRPGETGVVISRYNRIAGLDWVAIPLSPYLYAVEREEEVPSWASDAAVAELRNAYRRTHLLELAPDDPSRNIPAGDWIQLVGAAYDRNVYGFALETTPEQDQRLIEFLHSRENRRKFNLFYRNCADFAREILNFYHPGAVRRSIFGDLGITTPKHAAKSVVRYADRAPGRSLVSFVIPQIPGGRSSTRLRGVNESLVRSKKYVVPLALFQPWVAASAAVGYLTVGRFNPSKHTARRCSAGEMRDCLPVGRAQDAVLLAEGALPGSHAGGSHSENHDGWRNQDGFGGASHPGTPD